MKTNLWGKMNLILKLRNLFLGITISFAVSNPQAFAKTYFVSASAIGNDFTNDGLSTSAPFKTIKKALSKAWTSGDIVYVMSGVYPESVFISQSNITLSALSGHSPIINGGDSLPNKDWGSLLGIGGDYNKVSGFEVKNSNIKGTYEGGFGVSLLGHHNLVSKMNVHHTWVQGIFVKGDHNTVEESRVWQAALKNSITPGFEGGIKMTGHWPSGMSAARNDRSSALIPGITSYATFRKNVVYNNWGEGLSCFEADYCKVEDNISYDNWTVNFYLSDTTNSIVQRNIFYVSSNPAIPSRDGRRGGISLADEQGAAPRSANNKIINNFIYNADFNAFSWTGVSGSGLNGVMIANNTIVDGNFKTGHLGSNNIINTNSHVMNNIILGSNSIVPSHTGITFLNNNWLVSPAMGASTTDVSGDPMIARAGATTRGALTAAYFKLSTSSPVINKGKILLSVPKDFFNTLRGDYPDIGGHESSSTFGSSLIFRSNFGAGVSVGAPRSFSTIGAWQDITGLDAETGYSWPVTALDANFSGIQNITYDPINPDIIDDYIHSEIRTVTGPKGSLVRELFQTVKIKPVGIGSSQAPLLIRRNTTSDVKDLYISYWFKLQPDLLDKLDETVSSGNWRAIFEFKTGGFEGTGNGDYRIGTTILKRDGKLFWKSQGDSVANAPIDKIPKEVFWNVDNHDIPVPLDTWFKFEVYWHRSSGFADTTGRYWAAVDGQVIVDKSGESMMGRENLPVGRIMVDTTYSGGHPTVDSHITGLEIWNNFPCGMGRSCFNANIAPKINIPLPNQGFTESLPGKFVFPANTFVDPDGGAMTYSAKFVDGGIETALPAWLTFSPSTRTFSGTPPKIVKSYTIRVRATDDKAKSTYDDFVLKINNGPTLKSSLPDFVWTENIPHSYTFPFGTFSDVDGDALTYSAELVGGAAWPKWLTFTPSTRTLAGTPPRKAASFNIRITAKDANGLTANDDMVIKINNKPHVAAFVGDQKWNENKLTTFTIHSTFFQDIDGDVLTYSATGLPAWMTFTPSTRTFSGTPPRGIATYTIRIKVQDPKGLSVTDDFKVTVNNKPIVANILVDQSWSEGISRSYTIPTNTFTDIDGDLLTYKAVTLTTSGALPAWMSFNPITRTLSGKPLVGSGDIVIRVWGVDTKYLQVFDDVLIKTP